MTRPTKEQVERALDTSMQTVSPFHHTHVLADEVYALRLEAENASAEHRAACDELKLTRKQLAQALGKIGRCELSQLMYSGLARSWAASKDPYAELLATTYEFVASEIESCLRSEL